MSPTEIENVLLRILEGDNADELIRSLSEKEQGLFYNIVTEIRNGAAPELLDDLWKIDYTRRPPSIEEFITDPYWLGNTMAATEENPGIFPAWKEVLLQDFDLESRIHNLVITGSLGTGKSWVSSGIFLYRLTLATLLRNPQNFLGLSAGSTIVYIVLSLSKAVVQETVFGDVQNFMGHSAYFLEDCHFNPELKYSNFRIPLGKGIILTAGSKGQHIIGRNTMGVFLDEGNWRLEANPDMKAYKLYDEVRTRIKNRFQKVAGFLPAISILSSSARDESSFTEKVISDINAIKDPNAEKVYRFAVYKVKRHLLKLKNRWFKVAYGIKNVDPVVLSGFYLENGTPITNDPENPVEAPPDGCQTELVPEDYLDAFKRNAKSGLQNVCGISTGGSHLLLSSTIDVLKCVELGERSGVVNPVRGRMALIPISDEDDREIWDYLDHKSFLTLRHSQVIPIRHPSATRFAHLDLATATKAGLAICHLVGMQKVEGLIKNGQIYDEYRLIVEFDFILTITAGRTKPISLEKIQKFFFWLRGECGYHFGKITADTYQSAMPLQMMSSRGFETDVLSIDRKKAPYYGLRTGIEELRLRLYHQGEMLTEFEKLVDGPEKVDHPPEGSKDTTDAVCGAYTNAINSENISDSQSGTDPSLHASSSADKHEEVSPISIPIPRQPRKSQVFQA